MVSPVFILIKGLQAVALIILACFRKRLLLIFFSGLGWRLVIVLMRVQHEHEPESTQDSPLYNEGILEVDFYHRDSQWTQKIAEDHAKGDCYLEERDPYSLRRRWRHQVDPNGLVDGGYNLKKFHYRRLKMCASRAKRNLP